jgi:hypothetical protein
MGLELCINYSKQHNIQYKNIVMTRFDLTFKIDFNTCKIDLDAINIVSQTEGCMGLCDNLYIIPFRNSIEFLNALKMNILNNPHKLEPYFNKINKINFIYNEKKNIKDLSFYSINRSSKF